MPKQGIHCSVHLLDGKELVIDVQKIKTWNDFMVHVCNVAGLKDREFFGLSYIHPKDGKRSWIDFEKPVSRQLRKADNQLSLEIQFYPISSQLLRCLKSLYHFVLQTRRNILAGIWSCSLPSHALLASFVVQSEFGDYAEAFKENSGYLQEIMFFPSQPNSFIDNVKLFHERQKGMSPIEADYSYLESARKMKYYGMELHNVFDEDSNIVTLGANFIGMHVFYQDVKLHCFGWKIISRISSHACDLTIHLKPFGENKNEETSVVFSCVSQVDASRIEKSFLIQKSFYTGQNNRVTEDIQEKKQPNEPCIHTTAMKDVEINFDRISSKRLMELVLPNRTSLHESLSNEEDGESNTSKAEITSNDQTNESISEGSEQNRKSEIGQTNNPCADLSIEKIEEILEKAAIHANSNEEPIVISSPEREEENNDAASNDQGTSDVSDTEIIPDDVLQKFDVEDSFEKID